MGIEGGGVTDWVRGARIRKAIDLVVAVEASHIGLRVWDVEDIVGCGRRSAYRWIRGMVESGRYEWKKGRLRRFRVAGSDPVTIKSIDDWKAKQQRGLGKGIHW